MVDNIDIRCSDCGKTTGLFVKNTNTNNKDMITKFVLNTVLHHVGISFIIWWNQCVQHVIWVEEV